MRKICQISFIIPLFNHLDKSKEMIYSLIRSLPLSCDYEIILVDDCSGDGTVKWLESLNYSHIRYIVNPENLGYAKSNNVGAKLANGQILGLLNNDLIFKAGWLEPMLEILESPPINAGIVGNIQNRVDNSKIDHVGVELNPRAQFLHIHDIPETKSNIALEQLALTGACVLIYKADYDLVGGFDESYVNGCEDIDLCFKIRALGKKIYLAPQSQIDHHVSLSRNRFSLQNQRNSQILFSRWRSEILNTLTKQWTNLLKAGPSVYSKYIDGELTDQVLTDPANGAHLIAQSMFLREEYQWARSLGGADPNLDLDNRCVLSGLIPIPSSQVYLAEHEFELTVQNLRSVRSFFVCGRKINAQVSGPMAITITVDQNQTKTYILPRGEANINIGIVDPILSGGDMSRFKVRVDYVDEKNQYIEDAGKTILITHFVLDGQVIGAISQTPQ